jgi:hypothetical protein
MGKEMSQASFLNFKNVAILVLGGESTQMDDARDSRGHEPGETERTVDSLEDSRKDKVVVVSSSMFQATTGVVDQMPRDTVIKVNQDESKNGWSGCHEGNPGLSVEVTIVDEPWAVPDCTSLLRTVLWPGISAHVVTTREARHDTVRNLERLGRNGREELFDSGKENDRQDDRKVGNEVTGNVLCERKECA